MAISNNTYLDYDGLKVYTQALLGKFALSSKTPELDSNGIIKSQYLPSYVDDVVEYANRAAFPSTGEKSKLYLAQDTGDIYRWTGTQYVNMLSADGIAAQAAKVTNALTFGSKTYDGSLAQTITKADLGLGNVENVALSTWKGSTNITTLGVITTGTWQGTKIANAYLANSSITIGTTKFNLGDAKTAIAGLTSLLFSGASGALTYNKTDKYYSLADNLVVNGILASGTPGIGGGDGYSQVEWADIQTMTESVSGSLASAYAVKESYSELNTIVSTKADKITLDAVTKKVISLENKYAAVTTDIANHIGNTTVHITSAERTAWNNKQAAISDLDTIRSNAATAYDWGDHSKAGYITGITKAMVEGVLTGNITSHTHTFASLALKPTTLSGYGITDASRFFRYTIPASGNKGVRITFTSGEPVKITVSGANQGAQLVLIGTGYGEGGFVRNNFTEVVPSTNALYTWCVSEKDARSVEIFSARAVPDVVTVESPSLVTFTAISALSTDAVSRHLLTSENYSKYALPLTGGNVTGSIRMDGDTIGPLLIRNYSSSYSGGWARSVLECRVDDKNAFAIMPFGNYTSGATNNKIQYVSLGFAGYDGLNLRISDTSLTWGNDAIYHSGNSNNTSTVWSAKRLATPDNLICPYTWWQNDYNHTGTLVLSLPYGFNSMMQCIELTVYDYSTEIGYGGATKFFINGYNHAGNKWTNPYVFQIGNKNVKVRLGYYNNKCCILIGETNTKWTYPRICVDKVYGSYSSHANDFKNDDWSCAILQDESQITNITTASEAPLYAPCYTRAGLPYVTDNDVAAKYLKLTGGTMTGDAAISWGINDRTDWDTYASGIRVMSSVTADSGAPVQYATGISVMARYSFQIAAKGGNADNFFMRAGTRDWKEIYHAGNCNLPTIPWKCSSLTANGSVEAKANLYGQSLEFLNISSSANHGGFIDFHFNGSTADYTSRIIEDAAGQLTLTAGIVNIGTAAKGFLYLQRPSSNYIWANKAGGEICIGTADGGETSALNSGITIIGKRVYIGGTNSGSNALNVKGAIHATTGLYTDGYISAKQASTSSDRRLKKDFCKIDNALKYVLKTHYIRFRWKDDNKESIGIIAQEEQNREYGFLVQNNEKIGHLTYDYAASTALLGAAIQEEDSKVEKLKKRVAELEKELSNLKRKWQH